MDSSLLLSSWVVAQVPLLPTWLYYDFEAIQLILPHTGHALVLDGVRVDRSRKKAWGILYLGGRNAHLSNGHFDNNPTQPGHWTYEFSCLTAAFLAGVLINRSLRGKGIYLAASDKHRYPNPAIPGDTLEAEINNVTMSPQRGIIFSAIVRRLRDNKTVFTMENAKGLLIK